MKKIEMKDNSKSTKESVSAIDGSKAHNQQVHETKQGEFADSKIGEFADSKHNNTEKEKLVLTEAQAEDAAVAVDRLTFLSYFWTIFSGIYVIVSTCIVVSKQWVESTVSYLIVGFLVVFILAFMAILYFTHNNKKIGRKHLNNYRSVLRLFKAFANVMFLVVTAMSMAGVANGSETSIAQWLFFVLTFLVAIIQLGLKVALFVVKQSRKRIGKKYEVEVLAYVNGAKQKKKFSHKFSEKTYKSNHESPPRINKK